jgi:hypothetical protein
MSLPQLDAFLAHAEKDPELARRLHDHAEPLDLGGLVGRSQWQRILEHRQAEIAPHLLLVLPTDQGAATHLVEQDHRPGGR